MCHESKWPQSRRLSITFWLVLFFGGGSCVFKPPVPPRNSLPQLRWSVSLHSQLGRLHAPPSHDSQETDCPGLSTVLDNVAQIGRIHSLQTASNILSLQHQGELRVTWWYGGAPDEGVAGVAWGTGAPRGMVDSPAVSIQTARLRHNARVHAVVRETSLVQRAIIIAPAP